MRKAVAMLSVSLNYRRAALFYCTVLLGMTNPYKKTSSNAAPVPCKSTYAPSSNVRREKAAVERVIATDDHALKKPLAIPSSVTKIGTVETGATPTNTIGKQSNEAKLVTPNAGSASIKAQLKKQIAMLKRQELPTKVTAQPVKRKSEQAFPNETTKTESVDSETRQKLRQEQKQALLKEQIIKLEEKLQPKAKPPQPVPAPATATATASLEHAEKQGLQQSSQIVQPTYAIPLPLPPVLPPFTATYPTVVLGNNPPTHPFNMSIAPWVPTNTIDYWRPNYFHGFHPNYFQPPLISQFTSPFPLSTNNETNRNPTHFRDMNTRGALFHPPLNNTSPFPLSTNIATNRNPTHFRDMNIKRKTNLTLHKEPMTLPSPYAKSHILIPFEIEITKVKGQAFGLEIRYESQGTFVTIEEKVPVIKSVNNVSSESKAVVLPQAKDNTACTDTVGMSSAVMNHIGSHNPDAQMDTSSNDACLIDAATQVGTQVPEVSMEMALNDASCIDAVILLGSHTPAAPMDVSSNDAGLGDAAILLGSQIPEAPIEISSTDACLVDAFIPLESQIPELPKDIMSNDACLVDAVIPSESHPRETPIELLPIDGDAVIRLESQSPELPKDIMSNDACLVDAVIRLSSHPEETQIEISPNDGCLVDPVIQRSPNKSTETVEDSTMNILSEDPSAQEKILNGNPHALNTLSSLVDDKGMASQTSSNEFVTRHKKKRFVYGVMTVVNAAKQNNRMSMMNRTAKDHMLQPGDIILKIDDRDIGGLPFSEASSLFSKCSNLQPTQSSSQEEPIITCRLQIAREKKVVKILEKLASLSSKSTEITRSIARKETEMKSDEVAQKSGMMDFPDLIPRLFRDQIFHLAKNVQIDLTYSFQDCISECDELIDTAASSFWEKAWAAEMQQVETGLDERSRNLRLTDVQRQHMRNLPKPFNGCKCGSQTHEYVFDVGCPLYSDLRMFGTNGFIPRKEKANTKTASTNIDEALIQRQRYIQEKAAAEEQEAKFVGEMELVQVSVFHKAVFSPRLALTMLLSTIVYLSTDDDWKKQSSAEHRINEAAMGTTKDSSDDSDDDDDDDDDSDDDVPLAALGVNPQSKLGATVDTKGMPTLLFLARVLKFISSVWGHAFQEPEPFTFSWNEECKRVINKNRMNSSPSVRKNPRKPGNFTFEKFRYTLDDDLLERLSGQQTPSKSQFRDQLLVSYLVSNKKSGILSDVFVLMKAGVVRVDESSNISLCPTWVENLPQIILNDSWESGWDKDSDPENKFCISAVLRENISRHWKRCEVGWTCGNTMKFRHEEFEEQKASYRVMYDERVNAADGIAQFGV